MMTRCTGQNQYAHFPTGGNSKGIFMCCPFSRNCAPIYVAMALLTANENAKEYVVISVQQPPINQLKMLANEVSKTLIIKKYFLERTLVVLKNKYRNTINKTPHTLYIIKLDSNVVTTNRETNCSVAYLCLDSPNTTSKNPKSNVGMTFRVVNGSWLNS